MKNCFTIIIMLALIINITGCAVKKDSGLVLNKTATGYDYLILGEFEGGMTINDFLNTSTISNLENELNPPRETESGTTYDFDIKVYGEHANIDVLFSDLNDLDIYTLEMITIIFKDKSQECFNRVNNKIYQAQRIFAQKTKTGIISLWNKSAESDSSYFERYEYRSDVAITDLGESTIAKVKAYEEELDKEYDIYSLSNQLLSNIFITYGEMQTGNGKEVVLTIISSNQGVVNKANRYVETHELS